MINLTTLIFFTQWFANWVGFGVNGSASFRSATIGNKYDYEIIIGYSTKNSQSEWLWERYNSKYFTGYSAETYIGWVKYSNFQRNSRGINTQSIVIAPSLHKTLKKYPLCFKLGVGRKWTGWKDGKYVASGGVEGKHLGAEHQTNFYDVHYYDIYVKYDFNIGEHFVLTPKLVYCRDGENLFYQFKVYMNYTFWHNAKKYN